MANFRDFIYRLSPPWLRRFYGERLMGTLGLMADSIMEGASQALRAPRFTSGFQPPDALPLLGTERSMPRYPAESDDAYRARLKKAWDAWGKAGNDNAIEEQIKLALGLTNVEVRLVPTALRSGWIPQEDIDVGTDGIFRFTDTFEFQQTGASGESEILIDSGATWSSLKAGLASRAVTRAKVWVSGTANNDGYYHLWDNGGYASNRLILEKVDGSNPLTDEGPLLCTVDLTHWSRFTVFIDQPHPWSLDVYGFGGVYGEGDNFGVYGSSITQGEINTIKDIVAKWKDSESINSEIVVVQEDGDYYGKAGMVYSASPSNEYSPLTESVDSFGGSGFPRADFSWAGGVGNTFNYNTPMTLSLWVISDDNAGPRDILGMNTGSGHLWGITRQGQGYELQFQNGTSGKRSYIRNNQFGSNPLPSGTWRHIVFTRDTTLDPSAGGWQMYVDGAKLPPSALQYLGNCDGTITGGTLRLGDFNADNSFTHNGRTVHLTLWSRQITDAEVTLLYGNQQPQDLDDPDLISLQTGLEWWIASGDGDDITGTASGIIDLSGNGRHGTGNSYGAKSSDVPSGIALPADYVYGSVGQRLRVLNQYSYGGG